jgi:hypothetical protein
MYTEMYNVGDEIAIKVKVVEKDREGGICTEDSGGRLLWIGDEDVILPEETSRAKGMEEGWGMAKKIIAPALENGYTSEELEEIFGTGSRIDIFRRNTAQQAAEKIKAWEDKKEIKVGDVVIMPGNIRVLVTRVENNHFDSMNIDMDCLGTTYPYRQISYARKTGVHINIEDTLKEADRRAEDAKSM